MFLHIKIFQEKVFMPGNKGKLNYELRTEISASIHFSGSYLPSLSFGSYVSWSKTIKGQLLPPFLLLLLPANSETHRHTRPPVRAATGGNAV